MLVGNRLSNLVVQILVGQRLECSQTLIRQRWPKLRSVSLRAVEEEHIHQLGTVRFRIMDHGKVDVEKSDLHRFRLSVPKVDPVHVPTQDELGGSAQCIHG